MSTMTPKLVVFNVAIGGQVHSASKELERKIPRRSTRTCGDSDSLLVLTTILDSSLIVKFRAEKHDKLHDSVRELAESLYNVKREQSLMDVREHTHRQSEWPHDLWYCSSNPMARASVAAGAPARCGID